MNPAKHIKKTAFAIVLLGNVTKSVCKENREMSHKALFSNDRPGSEAPFAVKGDRFIEAAADFGANRSKGGRAPMNDRVQLVVFALDERRFALALSSIERAVRVVDVTPLPAAPSTVLGIVNVGGDVVAVYDLRRRFGLAEREINLGDQLIIGRTARQKVALLVDSVSGVIEVAEEKIAAAEKILPAIEYIHGIVKLPDGLVLIHDLDRFLSPEEERTLTEALKSIPKSPESVIRND